MPDFQAGEIFRYVGRSNQACGDPYSLLVELSPMPDNHNCASLIRYQFTPIRYFLFNKDNCTSLVSRLGAFYDAFETCLMFIPLLK